MFDTNPDHPEHYFKTDYIDNIATFKTYNFTTHDNVFLSKGFIETQEKLYKDIPAYKARVLLGEWIASTDSIFTQINITEDYVFTSPIAYLDPAFSIGGDNTALCVMERVDDKYYAFVFQDQRPANDPYIMNMVKTVLENFNVHTLYLEDRDDTKGSDGVCTSSKDKIENYPAKGYPYKRGVKLSFGDGTTELEVEAGGEDDLYGVCTDIDEFSGMATVIPITNNFTGYLTFKKNGENGIKPGDKLHFNAHGELEKNAGGAQKSANAIALSKVHKLNDDLSIVLASVFGNRALKGN
ncbi:hypothetical protein HNQ06_001122 [Borrelia lanei]|uniref:Lipoprotein n=1 Tax=Borreliella lanei TaxID=373540 RepID=A0A7X0DLV9_9SPIR|nr:hypothetical protein [Borreliella lanei]